MIDFEFNEIKVDKYENIDVSGICFANNKIYVGSLNDRFIRIFSSDLTELIEKKHFNYSPWLLQANKDTLCVKSGNDAGYTYFYKLDNFHLIHKFNHGYGQISVINSWFYEVLNHDFEKIDIFDENGVFVKTIHLPQLKDYIRTYIDGRIAYFYNYLLLLSNGSWSLLALKIQI